MHAMIRSIATAFAFAVALSFAASAPVFAQPATQPTAQPASDPAMKDLAQDEQKRAVVQPGNNAPVWREVRSGQPAYASVPGRETNVLVQNEGQEWRARRNGFWSILAGWVIVAVFAGLAIFHLIKGTTELEQPETGRKLLRFTQFERWLHWTVAIAWSTLGITGLVMLFGKNLLLPIIGYTLFSWLATIGKNLHNFIGPLFLVSVLIMFVTFVRDNVPRAADIKWLIQLGGLIGKHEPPSGKFNGGEKVWFWGGVLVLGLVVGISGLVLDFPNFDQTRSTMQWANLIHMGAAALFIAAGFGHIYLGTLGMAGAYEGMRTGLVDEEWAREHHFYWYEDIKAGKVDADPATHDGVPAHPASGPAD